MSRRATAPPPRRAPVRNRGSSRASGNDRSRGPPRRRTARRVRRGDRRWRRSCSRRLRRSGTEVERAGEHRERAPELALFRRAQLVAPIDHRPEGALAPDGAAGAAAKEREPGGQPARQLGDRERPQPRRRELDRERQPVEGSAQVERGFRVGRCRVRRRRRRHALGRSGATPPRTGRPRRSPSTAGAPGRPVRRRARADDGSSRAP